MESSITTLEELVSELKAFNAIPTLEQGTALKGWINSYFPSLQKNLLQNIDARLQSQPVKPALSPIVEEPSPIEMIIQRYTPQEVELEDQLRANRSNPNRFTLLRQELHKPEIYEIAFPLPGKGQVLTLTPDDIKLLEQALISGRPRMPFPVSLAEAMQTFLTHVGLRAYGFEVSEGQDRAYVDRPEDFQVLLIDPFDQALMTRILRSLDLFNPTFARVVRMGIANYLKSRGLQAPKDWNVL